MMDTNLLLVAAISALCSATVTVLAFAWWHRRAMAEMQRLLQVAKQSRAAAKERATQTRHQVEQLNQMLSQLKLTQAAQKAHEQRRDELVHALDDAEPVTLVLPRREAGVGFADTQIM